MSPIGTALVGGELGIGVGRAGVLLPGAFAAFTEGGFAADPWTACEVLSWFPFAPLLPLFSAMEAPVGIDYRTREGCARGPGGGDKSMTKRVGARFRPGVAGEVELGFG